MGGKQWLTDSPKRKRLQRETRQKPKLWKGSVSQVTRLEGHTHAQRSGGTGRPRVPASGCPRLREGHGYSRVAGSGLTQHGADLPGLRVTLIVGASVRGSPCGIASRPLSALRAAEASAFDTMKTVGDRPVGAETMDTAKQVERQQHPGPFGVNPKLFHSEMSIFISAGREYVTGEGPGRLGSGGSRWRRGTTQLVSSRQEVERGLGAPLGLVSPKRKQGEDLGRPDKAVVSHETWVKALTSSLSLPTGNQSVGLSPGTKSVPT